jgi:hypothetical protein
VGWSCGQPPEDGTDPAATELRHHVMYGDAMQRTQIYLGDEELATTARWLAPI